MLKRQGNSSCLASGLFEHFSLKNDAQDHLLPKGSKEKNAFSLSLSLPLELQNNAASLPIDHEMKTFPWGFLGKNEQRRRGRGSLPFLLTYEDPTFRIPRSPFPHFQVLLVRVSQAMPLRHLHKPHMTRKAGESMKTSVRERKRFWVPLERRFFFASSSKDRDSFFTQIDVDSSSAWVRSFGAKTFSELVFQVLFSLKKIQVAHFLNKKVGFCHEERSKLLRNCSVVHT